MSDFWSNWSKPWSKVQCEQRYIEGPRISLRQLSVDSGIPEPTLSKWSPKDKGNWKVKREEFQSDLTTQTRLKTLEKTSDRLSEELSELGVEHLQAYRVCRQIAEIKARYILKKMSGLFQEQIALGEDTSSIDPLASEFLDTAQETMLEKVDVVAINFLSLIIDRAVRGERMAAGMEYEDINKAIAAIEKTGLKVTAPNDSIVAQLATR